MYFEELREGAVYRTGSHLVTAEELHQFATAYDPQPMHLDREFAARGPFGDVIASGFHTMAVGWRLWVELGMADHGRGGIALDGVRWHRPLFAGTRITAVVRIEEVRLTRRGKGLSTMRFEVVDQDDVLLLEFRTTGLFARQADETQTLAVET